MAEEEEAAADGRDKAGCLVPGTAVQLEAASPKYRCTAAGHRRGMHSRGKLVLTAHSPSMVLRRIEYIPAWVHTGTGSLMLRCRQHRGEAESELQAGCRLELVA